MACVLQGQDQKRLACYEKKGPLSLLMLTLITVPNPLWKSLLGAAYSTKERESQGVGILSPRTCARSQVLTQVSWRFWNLPSESVSHIGWVNISHRAYQGIYSCRSNWGLPLLPLPAPGEIHLWKDKSPYWFFPDMGRALSEGSRHICELLCRYPVVLCFVYSL